MSSLGSSECRRHPTAEDYLVFHKLTAKERKESKCRSARFKTRLWRLSQLVGKRYFILSLMQDLVRREVMEQTLGRPFARRILQGALGSKGEIAYRGPWVASQTAESIQEDFFKEASLLLGTQEVPLWRLQRYLQCDAFKRVFLIQEDGERKNYLWFNELLVLDTEAPLKDTRSVDDNCAPSDEALSLTRWLVKRRCKALNWSEFTLASREEGKKTEQTLMRIALRDFLVGTFLINEDNQVLYIDPFSFWLGLHHIAAINILRVDSLCPDCFSHIAPYRKGAKTGWIQLFFPLDEEAYCPGCGKKLWFIEGFL